MALSARKGSAITLLVLAQPAAVAEIKRIDGFRTVGHVVGAGAGTGRAEAAEGQRTGARIDADLRGASEQAAALLQGAGICAEAHFQLEECIHAVAQIFATLEAEP